MVVVAVETSDMELELRLTCKTCGRSFTSALQMEPKTFENIRITNQLECCRSCSQVRTYGRDDYYFVDPSRDGAGSGAATERVVWSHRKTADPAARG